MGIRFLCPHCDHRLNVKTAQAGLAGECPQCSKPIEVPLASTITSTSSKKLGHTLPPPALDIDNQTTPQGLSITDRLAAANARIQPDATKSRSEKPDQTSFSEPTADSFLLDKPQPPTTLGKVDPIAEAPDKVWYFRSRELGEKGPLKSRSMQEQLDQGIVTIGCIVWREDWHDWQPAEKVFPSLVALAENTEIHGMPSVSGSMMPEKINRHSLLQRRKRQRKMLGAITIAAGLLTVAALVYLLMRLTSV